MEVFIGTIMPFGFSFAPQGWSTCAGQLVAISQNSALFSLLGTTYGGNGVQTFALPNLQGRMPIGMGNGAGLTPRTIGEMSGTENATLLAANMPMHNHTATATVGVSVAGTPAGQVSAPTATNNILGASGGGPGAASIWSNANSNPIAMGGVSGSVDIGMAGGSQPFGLMNPFLALNFCIALTGIFPSRN